MIRLLGRLLGPLLATTVLALAAVLGSAVPREGDLLPARTVPPLFEPARAGDVLDHPDRDRWQRPAEVVRELGLRPGETVADLGAGSGYLLEHLSRAVGPDGMVYAEEIQPEFLPALRRKAEVLGNVRVVLGNPTDPRLPPRSVDCFVMLTVYHEVQDPVGLLRRLRTSARPGARLAVVDFDPDRAGDPPPPADHSVREADVLREAGAAGWTLRRRVEGWGSQFFLVLEAVPTRRAP